MRAEHDLPWYFGTAAQSAIGDAGLRSSLGGQIEAIRSARTEDDRPGILERYVVESSRIEDGVIDRIEVGTRLGEVVERLSQLSDEHQHTLRLHYGTPRLAFALSGAAILTAAAHALVAPETMSREALNAALREAKKANPKVCTWLTVELEANALVGPAIQAYQAVQLPYRRKIWSS